MARQAFAALLVLAATMMPGLPASAADDDAVYAWLQHEQDGLPAGARVELVAIEETASGLAVFTVRYWPQGDQATVACQPTVDLGWTCVVTRSVLVEREELVG